MPGPQVVQLMPKQYAFSTDETHRELLYSGAFGAGKTRALCVRAVLLARYRGARVGLTRKTTVDLKSSTLITLLEPDGMLPPVLPPGTYEHSKAEQRIHLHNGGEITYFGCDDPVKVASRPLTDVCLDEGIEIDEDEYTMLLGRIRVQYKRPDGSMGPNTIATVTNPGAPTHFLHERFYPAGNDPTRLLIETNTAENYHLSQEYRDSLSKLTGPARDRYYLGLWVAFEGAIYWMFDTRVHVRHDEGPWDYYVVGVDVGMTHPSVMRVHGCKLGGPYSSHVLHEFNASNVTSPELVKHAQRIEKLYPRCTFIVPPECKDLATQLKRGKLNVQKPPLVDVLQGIRQVQGDLGTDPPMLTMEPGLPGTAEYLAYRWKDKVIREQPVKEADDAVDADRYARVYIAAGKGVPVRLYGLGDRRPPPIEQERAEHPADKEFNPVDPRMWPGRRLR